MTFYIKVPGQEKSVAFRLQVGEVLVLLGANGAGKSAIIDMLYKCGDNNMIKIAATRQNWFESGKLTMAQAQRDSMHQAIESWDKQNTSRFFEQDASTKVNLSLFDLVSSENRRARKITKAVESNNGDHIRDAISVAEDYPSVVAQINKLFAYSNMPIEISIGDIEQILASKNNCAQFDVASLSDGERNALIVAATTLTAQPGTMILIDEPERHLHRSIVIPFIVELTKIRNDCAFIISTHEILLPSGLGFPHILLIRQCAFANDMPTYWDFDYISKSEREAEEEVYIYEELKKDLMGARRRIIFVEGSEASLDMPLYRLIFPEVSIIPKGGCIEVERSVTGLRSSTRYHWIKAFGVIDEDRRSQETIENLKRKGIYAIKAYSIESIYYHPDLQRKVVEKLSTMTGEALDNLLLEAKSKAIFALKEAKDHLCRRIAEKNLRNLVESKMPTKKEIAAGVNYSIPVEVADILHEEHVFFDELINYGDLTSLICRYPIRESKFIDNVVKSLNFANKEMYQATVRNIIKNSDEILVFVRGLFGTLYDDLNK